MFVNTSGNILKDVRGRWRTNSLFWEWRDSEMAPIWSTKDHDHTVKGITYPSLKLIYFSYDHTPGLEYEFATEVLGGWDHWVKLTKGQLREMFEGWREELDIKLKATALKQVIKASGEPSASGVTAARYIAEKGYSTKRGRPSKEEVERTKRIEAGVEKELDEDFERIKLVSVK